MINETYKKMLSNKNIIRNFSEYATKKVAEVGSGNVYDFSLGNPSVPAPEIFTKTMIKMLEEENPMKLHGYSPTLGDPSFKENIAKSLNKRFGMDYTPNHIFPTTGAAGAIAHAIRAISKEGDTILCVAPFFPEYIPYIEGAGRKLKIVDADFSSFQINLEKLSDMIDGNVAAVLINTPNNPSGIVYSDDILNELADILVAKSKEYTKTIYLISDEPYREIVFDKKDAPYVSKYYDNTLSCYSFSKALSLPGERIGYVAVNPKAEESDVIVPMCGQISRGIGHNCPPSIIQQAVGRVADSTSDLSVYETNMNIIYDALIDMGFEVVRPGGTFYIMPKALEEDANEFCKKALKYDLILVPADNFGAPGYFRMAYCIDTDKVIRAMDVMRRFVRECYGR